MGCKSPSQRWELDLKILDGSVQKGVFFIPVTFGTPSENLLKVESCTSVFDLAQITGVASKG
jgi:hypothetical protein